MCLVLYSMVSAAHPTHAVAAFFSLDRVLRLACSSAGQVWTPFRRPAGHPPRTT